MRKAGKSWNIAAGAEKSRVFSIFYVANKGPIKKKHLQKRKRMRNSREQNTERGATFSMHGERESFRFV